MDCPNESECVALSSGVTTPDNQTHYVTCECIEYALRFNETTRTCQDVDECKEDSENVCPKEAVCQNTIGGFNCKCPAGYKWDSDTNKCNNVNECLCPGPSNDCYDQDKCGAMAGLCEDTDGSWICICEENFGHPQGSMDNQTCERIKDCANKIDICDRESTVCEDEQAGYSCRCKPGFQPITENEYQCENINECQPENPCPVHVVTNQPFECKDTVGSYYCQCSNGYVQVDATHCKDIDECLQEPCLANSECVNKEGTFEYLCPDGYNKTITGIGPLDYQCDIISTCDQPPCK
ncbi:unnamed protein product, partial [Mesorhabditis spiculigera]